jgi:hypothetical protein
LDFVFVLTFEGPMIKCKVEMWGLPREVSGLGDVEVQLEEDASLQDAIAALKRKVPALEGAVISPGQDRIEETCAFNINGCFYQNDENVQLKNGDCLKLVTVATGG